MSSRIKAHEAIHLQACTSTKVLIKILARVNKGVLLPFLSSVKILGLISKQCIAVVTQRKDKELHMRKKDMLSLILQNNWSFKCKLQDSEWKLENNYISESQRQGIDGETNRMNWYWNRYQYMELDRNTWTMLIMVAFVTGTLVPNRPLWLNTA